MVPGSQSILYCNVYDLSKVVAIRKNSRTWYNAYVIWFGSVSFIIYDTWTYGWLAKSIISL